jgi:hypothetical protein
MLFPHSLRHAALRGLLAAGLLALVPAAPSYAQSTLASFLSPELSGLVARAGTGSPLGTALSSLDKNKPLFEPVSAILRSAKASPYLAEGIPRIAELASLGLPGLESSLWRMARGGQSGAYEIAVAHAFRSRIAAVCAQHGGNEVDGLLKAGTVLEAKSGPPKSIEHLCLQVRRRGEGGENVVLALNYLPGLADYNKLAQVHKQMAGRLEVLFIPLVGNSYKVILPGAGGIAPDREPMGGTAGIRKKELSRETWPLPIGKTSSKAVPTSRLSVYRPFRPALRTLGRRF